MLLLLLDGGAGVWINKGMWIIAKEKRSDLWLRLGLQALGA
jgi:hypothetical protein